MFNYKINFIPTRFFVFGCGGTGSRLVPLISQYIASCTWLKAFDPNIYLIDFDEVETKNLARQNFIIKDVGVNKAEVLARRYSNAYGVPITSIPFKVVPKYKLDNLLNPASGNSEYAANCESNMEFLRVIQLKTEQPISKPGFGNSIIFICVDSIESRQDIVKFILEETECTPDVIIIDTGNENDFGQVKISGIATKLDEVHSGILENWVNNLPDISPITTTLEVLPFEYEYFENMKPPVVKASCADLEQTMAINSLVANTAFAVLQNLLSGVDITAHRYNISLSHGISAEYYTFDKLYNMYSDTTSTSNSKYQSAYQRYFLQSRKIDSITKREHWERGLIRHINDVTHKFPEMLKNYVAPKKKARKSAPSPSETQNVSEASTILVV